MFFLLMLKKKCRTSRMLGVTGPTGPVSFWVSIEACNGNKSFRWVEIHGKYSIQTWWYFPLSIQLALWIPFFCFPWIGYVNLDSCQLSIIKYPKCIIPLLLLVYKPQPGSWISAHNMLRKYRDLEKINVFIVLWRERIHVYIVKII